MTANTLEQSDGFLAVLVNLALSYNRELVLGLGQYLRSHPDCRMRLFANDAPALALAVRLRPRGIVAHVGATELQAAIARSDLPAVNVSSRLPPGALPRVGLDDLAIGRTAARHLLDHGFRQFGFLGLGDIEYVRQRRAGFAEAIAAAGGILRDDPPRFVHSLEYDARRAEQHLAEFEDWLRSDGLPVGLLACNDTVGVRCADACRRLGIRVPEDVAIVGVDDDEAICESSWPPLSSVAIAGERVGWEAGRLVDAMIHGEPPPAEPILIPPMGVRERQSSEIDAIADPMVINALRFIRRHATDPITVDDVAEAIPLSRRMLEKRFREHTGRTLAAEIQNKRMARACELLRETDLPVIEVAMRSGYSSSQRLNEAFRRAGHPSPNAYRRQYRQLD